MAYENMQPGPGYWDDYHQKMMKVDTQIDYFEHLLKLLPQFVVIEELRLANLTLMSRASKASLKTLSFPGITSLKVANIPEAGLLIQACPNLHTFRTDFPCPKPKTTLNLLVDRVDIVNVELENKIWKPKQVEGKCHIVLEV
jgi:hypothetical protein